MEVEYSKVLAGVDDFKVKCFEVVVEIEDSKVVDFRLLTGTDDSEVEAKLDDDSTVEYFDEVACVECLEVMPEVDSVVECFEVVA